MVISNQITCKKAHKSPSQIKPDKIPTKSELELKEKFKVYKQKHGKVYESAEEESQRFQTYKKNLDIASTMQKKAYLKNPNDNTVFGETKFSDLTPEEFSKYYLTLNTKELLKVRDEYLASQSSTETDTSNKVGVLLQSAPDKFDWRERGAVTPIKNQGQCGSCWAFSTITTIECLLYLKNKVLANLSAQMLLDCDTHSFGCRGGYLNSAYNYGQSNGIMLESDYPYLGWQGFCQYKRSKVILKVNSYDFCSSTDETVIRDHVYLKGVLSVAVNADSFQYYIGGILDLDQNSCPSSGINHAVNTVGYGSENGVDYWIVKNSYGATWGENGYIRIARGKGTCGINRISLWATLV